MFRRSDINNFFQSAKAAGVECIFLPDGKMVFNAVILKKKNGKIISEFSESGIGSIEELKKKIKTDIPVCLVVNGKGIIHKKVSVSEQDNEERLLQKAIPNTKLDDFYLQKTNSVNSSAFISVIRRNVTDELLNEFKKSGFYIVSCSLGPFSIQSIIPLIEKRSEKFDILIRDSKLSIAENRIETFLTDDTVSKEKLSIGNSQVENDLILSFTSAIRYFAGEQLEAITEIPSVAERKQDIKQKTIFKTAGAATIVFFFVVMVGNLFIYTYYKDKKQELASVSSLNSDKLLQYDSLQKEFAQKQKFFEESGLLQASKSSWYADEIARDVPETIQLMELSINPMEKKSNLDEDKIVFSQDIIRIRGNCKKSTQLNLWISELKKKSWVKQVDILNFSQGKLREAGIFTMELAMN